MKAGRNDPCPCGSGKKYKKCCGDKKVVSLTGTVVREELDQLYYRFQDYIMDHYPYLLNPQEPIDQMEEFKDSMMVADKTILQTDSQGQSIMQEFVDRVKKGVSRPITREALEHWPQSIPGLFTVVEKVDKGVVKLEREWTEEVYEVNITLLADSEVEVMTHYFGILMNWGNYYQFVPSALSVDPELFSSFSNYVKMEYEASHAQGSIADFYASHFSEYLIDFLHFDVEDNLVDSWDGSEEEKEVLWLLDQKIDPLIKQQDNYIHLHHLWMYYCDHHFPTVRKPEVFAATLEYYYKDNPHFGYLKPVTQKEVAKKYGVSPNSISRRVEEMDEAYFNLLQEYGETDQPSSGPVFNQFTFPSWEVAAERANYEMIARLSRENFSTRQEMESFIQASSSKTFVPKTNEEMAQLLAYDAYVAETVEKRKQLVNEALHLHPKSVDARVLQAHLETEPLRKLNILYKASRDALIEGLDLDSGELWNDVTARPFMRAQELLASVHAEEGDLERAIELYEELLKYNENDNQGIRQEIFPLYMKSGQLEKAEEILRKYPDDGTWGAYSEALLTIEEGHPPELIEEFLFDAEEENPLVLSYLAGMKSWDKLPRTYQPGSEEEAIVYHYRNASAWKEHLHHVIEYLNEQFMFFD
ncbi:MAG: SEC-C metal-binding domain-containing protein [Halobacillus sp.]|uniref:SEC-C metal-binding domain-containing protein n=1 Tax=Halobacillus sp. TaxID=56800 RepID=UPI003BAEE1B8